MTVWFESDEWKLECWHNGLSFELTNKKADHAIFIQGDDASKFQDELEQCEKAFPNNTHAQNYAWLWDQCEYGAYC